MNKFLKILATVSVIVLVIANLFFPFIVVWLTGSWWFLFLYGVWAYPITIGFGVVIMIISGLWKDY